MGRRIGSLKGDTDTMNADVIKGKWPQLKGDVKERWGRLTHDDVEQINGSADKLVGVLQERYSYAREQAQRQIDSWLAGAGY